MPSPQPTEIPAFDDLILSVPRPHVLLVTLNRPAQRNAVNRVLNDHLNAAWDYYEMNSDLWVAVITGAETCFCAGMDLAEAARSSGVVEAGKMLFGGFGGLVFRQTLNKPVIAAVNGVAFGGGFELALSCDIIIAAEDAQFGMLEVKRGLSPLAGGSANLQRVIGYHNAMHLMLTGRKFPAPHALSVGLVQQLVPVSDLVPTALDLAAEIAANSPDAVRAAKAQAREAREKGWTAGAKGALVLPETAAMLAGPNLREGLRAFKDKRDPAWQPPAELGAWRVVGMEVVLWGLSLVAGWVWR